MVASSRHCPRSRSSITSCVPPTTTATSGCSIASWEFRRQSPEVTAAERQLYTVEDDSGERATWWGWSMTGTMFAMARLRLMTRISSYVTEDVVERLLIGGRPRLLESALPRVISRKTPSRVRLEGER